MPAVLSLISEGHHMTNHIRIIRIRMFLLASDGGGGGAMIFPVTFVTTSHLFRTETCYNYTNNKTCM